MMIMMCLVHVSASSTVDKVEVCDWASTPNQKRCTVDWARFQA